MEPKFSFVVRLRYNITYLINKAVTTYRTRVSDKCFIFCMIFSIRLELSTNTHSIFSRRGWSFRDMDPTPTDEGVSATSGSSYLELQRNRAKNATFNAMALCNGIFAEHMRQQSAHVDEDDDSEEEELQYSKKRKWTSNRGFASQDSSSSTQDGPSSTGARPLTFGASPSNSSPPFQLAFRPPPASASVNATSQVKSNSMIRTHHTTTLATGSTPFAYKPNNMPANFKSCVSQGNGQLVKKDTQATMMPFPSPSLPVNQQYLPYSEITGDPFGSGLPLDSFSTTFAITSANEAGTITHHVPASFMQRNANNILLGGEGARDEDDIMVWNAHSTYPPRATLIGVSILVNFRILVPGRGMQEGTSAAKFSAATVRTLRELKINAGPHWRKQFRDLALTFPGNIFIHNVSVEARKTHSTQDWSFWHPIESKKDYDEWFDTNITRGRCLDAYVRLTYRPPQEKSTYQPTKLTVKDEMQMN